MKAVLKPIFRFQGPVKAFTYYIEIVNDERNVVTSFDVDHIDADGLPSEALWRLVSSRRKVELFWWVIILIISAIIVWLAPISKLLKIGCP